MIAPQPGFWLIKLVKNGPPVPACIRWVQTTHEPGNADNPMERSRFLAAEINGQPVDIDRVWLVRGREIDGGEYRYRCAVTDWAMDNAPESIEASPTKSFNLATAAPVYRRKA
jgi:hypothetical protein